MNLVIIAALIAVCGAAKLDRTYLPPASAKTAGGSPGSLQTPLQNSLGNNGLGGLPKGSFTNDFEGVVVDAVAAGTRASGNEETGLGAPRLSYGSANSKVGAAGFKTNNNAFNDDRQSAINQRFQSGQGSNFPTGGSERPRAALDRSANILRFESEVGPEAYSYGFETDNGIVAEENGVATNGVQAQGGYSYTGDDGQVYSVTYTADEGGYQPKGDHLPTPPPIPEEILRSLEQNARDEAAGLIDDGSYDAQKYNAGSDYSESDNTHGKFSHSSSNFGQVDATGSGSFISQSNQPFGPGLKTQGQTKAQAFSGQPGHSHGQDHGNPEHGHGESVNGALGTNEFAEQSSHEHQTGATNNRFGSGSSSGQVGFGGKQPQGSTNRFSQSSSNRFEGSNANRQPGQSGFNSAQSQTNAFGSSAIAQSNQGLANRNVYLPPTNGLSRPQNGRLQSSRPQADSSPDSTNQFAQAVKSDEGSDNFVALSQQKLQESKQQQGSTSTSYNQPISSVSGQSNFGTTFSSESPSSNNGRPSSTLDQGGQSSQASASFGSRVAYLPPTTGSNQNRFSNRPSASFGSGSQFNQQSSQSADTHSSAHEDSPSQGSFTSKSTSTVGSQPTFGSQQSEGFQKSQTTSNERPSPSKGNLFSPAQSSSGFNSQKATSEPQTELTTPFESTADSSSAQSSQTSISDNASFGSRPANGRPSQSQFGNQFYSGLAASPTQSSSLTLPSLGSQLASRSQAGSLGPRPPTVAPTAFAPASTQSQYQSSGHTFPTQAPQREFNQQSQFNQKPQFGQQSQGTQSNDAQYSPSTQRASTNQQRQGSDDSYYYNQPSQPFNTPDSSRFPSVPSNQFNRVAQGSTFAQSNSQFRNDYQDTSATSFGTQSGKDQGHSKYPRPPTVAPTAFAPASTQSQYQSSGLNDITQASISPFPSQAPTQSSHFNTKSQFDSRPQSSNQFGQNAQKPSFGQQTTFAQSSYGSQSSPQRPTNQQPSSQSQAQAQTFQQQDLNRNQPENDDTSSPSVATQQYNGEIYDYTKPTQTLPAPEGTETTSGQFGQKKKTQFSGQPRPQVGQPQVGQDNENSQTSTNSQFSQKFQSTKPEFGTQSSIPQFGQNNFAAQNSQQQSTFDSRPQFGQPTRTPFGQTASAQATFGSQSTSAQAQSELMGPSKFGSSSRFSSQTQTQVQDNTEGSKPQFGFGSPCCQFSQPSSGSHSSQSSFGAQPTTPNFGAQPTQPSFQSQFGQNRFGSQSTSFTGALGTSPTSSSFAGQGEVFDASRKPPASSFDSETGYHY